jgi:hypothetical protein
MKLVRIATAALALALAGCVTGEVYTVDKPIPTAVQSAGLYQIEAYINAATSANGWKVDRLGRGELRATLEWDTYVATAMIVFNAERYSIRYHSSINLRARDGAISPQYNIRVRALESEIDRRMKPAT